MADITEEERKKIQCRTALKEYLDKVFADIKLENLLFNGRHDIDLLRAENAETDAKGAKVAVVYGIDGIGAYRKVEDKALLGNTFYCRWGHFNSSFALAFALARDSGYALKPEDLEARLGPYKQMAAQEPSK